MRSLTVIAVLLIQLVSAASAASNFFNDTVFGYSLVNETTGAQLFYHYVPATGDTVESTKKPVILWLQGGPGCAGEYANIIEFGPYVLVNESGTLNLVARDFSWSGEANILFVDNPSDTGYSLPGSELVIDSVTSAKQIYTMLEQFFTNHSSLLGLDFWIMGESYGGHYVPAVAYEILSKPSAHIPKITGIAMQNPWTDAYSQLEYFGATPYAQGIIDPKEKDRINKLRSQGQEALLRGDFAAGASMFDSIENWIASINVSGGIFTNNYRYWQYGQPHGKIFDAYGLTQAYLSQDDIKEKFGVNKQLNYGLCNGTIYNNWNLDNGVSYLTQLGYVLDRVKGIIYNGADDMECNTAGVLNFVKNLKWSGWHRFMQAKRQIWRMKNDKVAGSARVGGNLTFVTVYKAGHFVPFDQLYVSLDILQRVFASNDDWNTPFNL